MIKMYKDALNPKVRKLFELLELTKNEMNVNDDNIKELDTCINTLVKFNIPESEDLDKLKKYFEEQNRDISQECDDIVKMIENYQEKCEHCWEYEWNDSHHDYYVCKNCGKRMKD